VGNALREDIWRQLLTETEAMARYALAAGLAMPPKLVGDIHDAKRLGDRSSLATTHNQLVKLVAPAKPGTIRILEDEKKDSGIGRYLGPIHLVRQLMVISVVFLAVFVALATTTHAGIESTTAATVSRGWSALAVVIYLFSAAGLGATFSALWRVHRYIEDGTYDRTYDASYWIMIMLGLIAGLVLALVIPIKSVAGQPEFSKPLLALLGGYSAPAVHRILTRLVLAIETLFRADPKDVARAKQQQVAAERTAERTKFAARLMILDQAVANGTDPAVAREHLWDLIALLLPDLSTAPPLPPQAPSQAPALPAANDGAAH
jgi:hypothetical protein